MRKITLSGNSHVAMGLLSRICWIAGFVEGRTGRSCQKFAILLRETLSLWPIFSKSSLVLDQLEPTGKIPPGF